MDKYAVFRFLLILIFQQIPDPTAAKPDDWDVPPQMIDPSAVKPENWLDDEEDMIPGGCRIAPFLQLN